MEDIYTIKVKSNPDPRNLYPSERKYSASTVLGLSVVHISLAITTLLLTGMILMAQNPPLEHLNATISENATVEEEEFNHLFISPCVMALTAFGAGFTGLLAWKKWYVDRNIQLFFAMSTLSLIASAICLLITGLALKASPSSTTGNQKTPSLKFVLALNVFIASILEVVWSVISARLAWHGARSSYPEDVVLPRGKPEVSTVRKGNLRSAQLSPDILRHGPTEGKFARHFPRKDEATANALPKGESVREYRQRIDQFLDSHKTDYGSC